MRIRSAVSFLAMTAAFLACAKRPPPAELPKETPVVTAAPPSSPPSATTEAQPTKPLGSSPLSCTGTPTNISPLWKLATDARGGAICTLDSTVFGNAAAGEPCMQPSECAPSCCACSDGTRAVMTSLCLNGRCSSATDACCALAGTMTESCGPPGRFRGHDRFRIIEKVFFSERSAKVEPAMAKLLDDIAERIKRNHVRMVRIEGHNDNTGSADFQLEISQQRADAVRDYLVKQGIEALRMQSVGYAAKRPIDTNSTEEGRAHNRRVEFIVME